MIPPFLRSLAPLLLTCTLVLALAGCQSEEEKQKTLAAKLREKTSIPDQSEYETFRSFMGRLRLAVAAKDMRTIASMMTPDFGYRLEPPGEGDGVFAFWDKHNVWPELNHVLREKFTPLDNYMVAPPDFVKSSMMNTGTYHGFRA